MNGQIPVKQRIANVKQFLLENSQLSGVENGGDLVPPQLLQDNGMSEQLKNIGLTLIEMKETQYLERLRFEKDNAVAGDINVHDWAEVDVPPGSIVVFNILINEGWVFHCKWVNCTFADDTTYTLTFDGRYEPPLSEFIMDYADHYRTFEPPIRSYSQAQITALNLSETTNTYSVFYGGFLRRYKRTTELLSEETSLIEKSITDEPIKEKE